MCAVVINKLKKIYFLKAFTKKVIPLPQREEMQDVNLFFGRLFAKRTLVYKHVKESAIPTKYPICLAVSTRVSIRLLSVLRFRL